MNVQTDVRAGWDNCYKCGQSISLDVDVCIDIVFGVPCKRHCWC
jgi:hypothetical protein